MRSAIRSALRRPRIFALAGLTLLGLMGGGLGSATAQSARPFRFTDVDGSFEVGVRWQTEDRTRRRFGRPQSVERLELSELLRVNTGGYAYHPRFLTFRGGIEFEAIQSFRDGNDRLLPGGNWRLNFLPEHSFGGAFFGRIQRFQAEQTFTRVYPVNYQLYGGSFYSRAGFLPFELTVQHRSRISEDDRQLQNSDVIGDDVNFRGRYQQGRSEGKVEYYLTLEEVQGRDVRRQGFFASNFTYFDEEKRKSLRAILRFSESVSTFVNLYTISGLADYTWKHTPTFSSQYSFEMQWDDTNSQAIRNLNPKMRFRHQLYASLTSQLELYARFQDASFGRNDTYGGLLTESYTKRLGRRTRLNSEVGFSAELVRRRPDQVEAQVTNESHLLYNEVEVVLNKLEIFVPTIVVTDDTGGIIYDEGPDYTVVIRGNETSIRSRTSGRIGDGSTALVSYRYKLPGEGDVLSRGISVLASVNFLNHYMIYGKWNRWDQDVISGIINQQFDSRRVQQVVGLRLNWSWISIRVEFENVERTLPGSFRSVSENITLTPLRASRWNIQISGGHRFQTYTDSGQEITQVTTAARVSAALTKRILFEISGDYRLERWRGGPSPGLNNLDDVGAEALLSWRYKAIRVELEGRLARLMRVQQDEDLKRVMLRVRRLF